MKRRSVLALAAAAWPDTSRVEVIAHRGEHVECPENTLPAIRKAIEVGADWVEIDVRTTKDGHYVLMHNSTVEATTDGRGAVAELTLKELRALDAGARRPKYRGTPVPTLDEALAAMRGRCGVYFDAKQIPAAAIAGALDRHGMTERCRVYGGWPLLKELTARGLGRLTMPEAVSVENVRKAVRELGSRVIAFDRRDFVPEIIAAAGEAGVGIFVDRLGEQDTPERWREAMGLGATGIQTDHPGELRALLR